MKKFSLLTVSIALIVGCQSPATEETKEIRYSSYGNAIPNENAMSVQNINTLMEGSDSLKIRLSGTIEKTCKMKGCWMTVKTGETETMRVTFQDYGFFVPKDSVGGRNAIFEGKAFKTITSVEMLKHYAQDEGKSSDEIKAITEPKEEYTFVATGVLIEEVAELQ